MLRFLIPTAKEMNLQARTAPAQTYPQSQALIEELAQLDSQELSLVYKIKEAAAQVESQRWQAIKEGTASYYPALELFNGLMYRQIERDLSTEEQAYRDQHLFICSSLYGIIPAAHPIAPHRLDFNCRFKPNGLSLKAYWKEAYDSFIQPEDKVISLLSSEFETVFSAKVRQNFISLNFYEEKDGQLKSHSTISKKGRGLLVNKAIKEQVTSLDQLKELSFAGFVYRPDLSQDRQLTFVRKV